LEHRTQDNRNDPKFPAERERIGLAVCTRDDKNPLYDASVGGTLNVWFAHYDEARAHIDEVRRVRGEQSQPSVEYSLQNGCPSAASAMQYGSWTVTLTSVVPAVVPADAGFLPGTAAYTAHGSLTATLDRYTSASSPNGDADARVLTALKLADVAAAR
jgi:hypothetical protein